MSYDIFLKIDGIDGESMDDKHKNEIEVLSWRWNIHQESTMHAGSGLGKSVWRATYKIPDPPEKSWYSRFMPKKKVELDAGIEQSAIVIKERDD